MNLLHSGCWMEQSISLFFVESYCKFCEGHFSNLPSWGHLLPARRQIRCGGQDWRYWLNRYVANYECVLAWPNSYLTKQICPKEAKLWRLRILLWGWDRICSILFWEWIWILRILPCQFTGKCMKGCFILPVQSVFCLLSCRSKWF